MCVYHVLYCSIKKAWNLQIWVVNFLCFLSFGWETCTSDIKAQSFQWETSFQFISYYNTFVLAVIRFNLNVFSPLLLLVDQFVCHTEAIADIVILVDGSWSIGRLNFRLVRMFLENLVNAFDIGIDKTRIGGSQLRSFLNRWVHHGNNMVFGCLCKCFNRLNTVLYVFMCF